MSALTDIIHKLNIDLTHRDADIIKLKAELAEAKVNRDAWVRSLLVERDSANADADLLGRAVHEYGKPFNERTATAMQAVYNRPTAAARVKGGA